MKIWFDLNKKIRFLGAVLGWVAVLCLTAGLAKDTRAQEELANEPAAPEQVAAVEEAVSAPEALPEAPVVEPVVEQEFDLGEPVAGDSENEIQETAAQEPKTEQETDSEPEPAQEQDLDPKTDPEPKQTQGSAGQDITPESGTTTFEIEPNQIENATGTEELASQTKIEKIKERIRYKQFRQDQNPEFVFPDLEDKRNFFQKIFNWITGKKRQTKIQLVDPAGNITENGILLDGQNVKIENIKHRQFRPGLYKIKAIIELGKDTQEETREFEWGVLTANTNKTIYNPDDIANLYFGVLDQNGHTICDAQISLAITDPQGSVSYPQVNPSGNCGQDNITEIPDYSAIYQTTIPGKYDFNVIAQTAEGAKEIGDSFEVREYPEFDITRNGPTRINPKADYQMKFTVIPAENYSGTVIEQVSADFEIFGIENSSTTVAINGDTKTITWQVDWQASSTYEFSYTFNAPDISPTIFLLGPLTINDFSETRQWQIASDAVNNCVWSAAAAGNWSETANWTDCGGGIPQTGDTITFDATSVATSTVDAGFTNQPSSITVTADYTSTITQAVDLSATGGLTLNGGSWDISTYNLNLATSSLAIASGKTLSIASSTDSGLTVADITNAGNISCTNYAKITLTGAWDNTGGTFTSASSTVEFVGTGSQTIPALNYYNLTSSSTGARVLASSGTIGIAGAFTPGENSYTTTGSTIDFNGTGTQTIPPFNYNNLTSSNSGARTLYNGPQIGNSLSISSVGVPALAAFSSTRVAFVDSANDQLRTYDFDGTNWTQTGNSLSISNTNSPALAALSSTRVAFIDDTNDQLRAYDFDGTNWTQIGNSLNISHLGRGALAALSSSRIAFFHPSDDQLRTYDFDGTNWTQTGNSLTVSGGNLPALAVISSSSVAFIDDYNDQLRTYNFDGINWSQIGNSLAISNTSKPCLAQIVSNRVAFIDSGNGQLRTYDFDDTNWTQVGASLLIDNVNYPALANLNSTRLVFIEQNYDRLSTYEINYYGGTIGISGTFTPGTNSYTTTGSTIDFKSTSSQTIPAFNYYNLTSSSSGDRTLATSTIGVAGTFTPGTNTYAVASSTIDFNGSGSQTIPAFNYNNLTSSSTGARTLASSGTIGIAGSFDPGWNTYTVTGSTIDFNGTGSQTIPSFNYNNLTSSNSGARILYNGPQIGNSLSISGASISALAALSSSRVAFIDNNNDQLRTYDFDGTNWSQTGNGLSISNTGAPALAALSSSRVAFIDNNNDQLRTYDFDGTNWSQTGNSLSISGIDVASLASLSSTRVAFIDRTNKQLRTYDFDGTTWSQAGNSLSISNASTLALTALTSSRVAFIDEQNDQLRAYDFDGTNWSQTGNSLAISTGVPALAALSSSRVAFIDLTNDQLRAYDFNGTDWAQTGASLPISGDWPTLAALSSSRVAFIDSTNDQLRTYEINYYAGSIGIANTFTPGTNSYTTTGSTINFNKTSSQTIPAFNYYNLTSTNYARVLASSGTVGVANTFTPGTGAYTITGSTIDFNGDGSQTIPAFNYNNLTSSSTGARILASSGTVGIANTFTPGTNSYTITGSTVDFNGTAIQTVSAFNYNNLRLSGTRTTNSITLANSGTIGIAGIFYPEASFTSGGYVTTGSTVDFNGTSAQTIPAFNYYNLSSSSAGSRTLGAIKQTGNSLSVSSTGNPALAALSSTRVAFIDYTNDQLRAYDFNGTNWTQTGNSLSISNVGIPILAALSSTRVAFIDYTNDQLRAYDFDGTNWSQAGNSLTVSNVNYSALAALTSSRVAFIDASNKQLRAYDFDGTNWSQTGNSLTISSVDFPALAALSTSRVAFIDGINDQLRTYDFDGANWTQTGSSLSIIYVDVSAITSLSSTRMAFIDSTNDQLRTYDWGASIGVGGTFTPGTNSYTATGSTIDFNGAAQNVADFDYYNLALSNTGSKTFAAQTDITANMLISDSAKAALAAATNSAVGGALYLGASEQYRGTHGSTASPAVFQNDTWFAASTGYITTAGGLVNSAPSFSTAPHEDPESSTSTPTTAGNNVTIKATAADDNGHQWYLAVCKTNEVATTSDAAPTCPGGDWGISTATDSGSETTITYNSTTTDAESNDWYAFACDKFLGDPQCSAMSNSGTSGDNGSPFEVNHAPDFTAVVNSGSKDPGAILSIGAVSTDADIAGAADIMSLFVCKSNDFTGSACGAGGEWCSGTSTYPVVNDKGYTSTNLLQPEGVAVSGNYAYVIDAYDYQNSRLAIFDISNPDAIVAKGYTSTNLRNPTDIAVSGNYVYVTNSNWNLSSLAIFDISNPDNIVAKGVTTANLNYPENIAVSGNYAYITSWYTNRLAIFDISNPNNIIAKGTTTLNMDSPQGIAVYGNYAYVASWGNSRLAIFDISNPDAIVAKGYTSTNLSYPGNVAVSGNYAFVMNYADSSLAIFDISNPDSIVAKGYTATNLNGAESVEISGNYAYMASATDNRLAIFDISNPDLIVAKGYNSTNLSSPRDAAVFGNYAYVASQGNSRLAIFDIAARLACDLTVPNPANSSYNYYPYIVDNHGLVAAGGGQGALSTFSVNNVAPVYSVEPHEDPVSTDALPINAGDNVIFKATASDANNGDQWYLAVCKYVPYEFGDPIVPGDDGPPICYADEEWGISGAVDSGSEAVVSYTALADDSESNAWYAYVCDKVPGGGSCSAYSSGSGDSGSPFVINHRPALTSVSNNGPKNPGETITVTANPFADSDIVAPADSVSLHICKANDWTGSACGAAGEWCSVLDVSIGIASKDYTNANLDYPYNVAVLGDYAYVVSSNNSRLAIFDISNPDLIVAKGYTDTNLSGPYGVAVLGDYAYVASSWNSRLAIFDVSNPDSIVAKGYTETNLSWPTDVAVFGNYAYITSSGNSRLAIFDISNPDLIVAKGYLDTNLSSPSDVAISGNYAYLTDSGNSRLAIFDISNPDLIVAKGYTDTNLSGPYGVAVLGDYAYVASSWNSRLAIFDVSNPDLIVAKGYTSTNLSGPNSVAVSGNYAYVASSWMAIFDISNPDLIVAKGYTDTNLSGPYGVAVSGDYAYVSSSWNSSLAIFEISNNLKCDINISAGQSPGNVSYYPYAIDSHGLVASGGVQGVAQTFLVNGAPNAPMILGGASYVDGSWGNDNTPILQFIQSDDDATNTLAYRIQIDNDSNFASPVVDYTSALMAQGAASFVVGQGAGSGVYTMGSEGQNLSDGTYYWRVMSMDNYNGASAWSTANSGNIAFGVDVVAPTSVAIDSISPTEIQLQVNAGAVDAGSGLHASPYWFFETTGNSGGSSSTSWQATSTFTDSGLSPNTLYTYRVKARDALANESASSTEVSKYTLANAPASATAVANSGTQITLSWQANDNPGGTEYFAEIVGGANSGWMSNLNYAFDELTCATAYNFRVKARNQELAETDWTAASASTAACPVVAAASGSVGGQFTWQMPKVQEAIAPIAANIAAAVGFVAAPVKQAVANIGRIFNSETRETEPAIDIEPKNEPEPVSETEAVPTKSGPTATPQAGDNYEFLTFHFPDLKLAWQKLGINGIGDFFKSGNAKFSLPGIDRLLGLGQKEKTAIADLPPETKQKLPTNFAFGKTANLDLNSKLKLNADGGYEQSIHALAGRPVHLTMRAEAGAKSAAGYLIVGGTAQNASGFFAKIKLALASLASGQERSKELLLQKFAYADPDNDGVYEADITAPGIHGNYTIKTEIEYQAQAKKEFDFILVVDPEGYVWTPSGLGQTRVEDAQVSLYWQNPATGQFELWPAGDYQQTNPQITGVTGQYAFLAPPGTYRLEVVAPDFKKFTGKQFQVQENNPVNENIKLAPAVFGWKYFDWKFWAIAGLLGLLVIFQAFNLWNKNKKKAD